MRDKAPSPGTWGSTEAAGGMAARRRPARESTYAAVRRSRTVPDTGACPSFATADVSREGYDAIEDRDC